jgi:hypothetical protein
MSATLVKRELWGGAAEADVPAKLRDASDFRPIPDHQEVFSEIVVASDDGAAPVLLLFEIVEREAAVTDSAAAAFFFRDLADANDDALSGAGLAEGGVRGLEGGTALLHPSLATGSGSVGGDAVLVSARGRQRIARPPPLGSLERGAVVVDVSVFLAVLRLPHVASEVLISFTAPAAAQQEADEEGAAAAERRFADIVRSFRVLEWSLFGGEEDEN